MSSRRESEQEIILKEIFRHTPVGVALLDMHGTIFDANPAFGRIVGLEPAVLSGTNFGTFVEQDHAADFENLLTWLREGRIETTALTLRLVDSNEDRVTVNLNLSVVESTDEEPAWCIAFVENVEQRVRVESRLRDTENRYKRIVEDQTDLISRSKPDGTLLFVNDAYCRHYKVRREDVLGKSFFDLVEETDRDAVRQKLAALTPEHPVRSGEHQVLEPDGGIGWQQWIDRGFFDEAGHLVELQSVGRDVTEEREANARLRASEERLRLLFNNISVPVWESDWTEVVKGLHDRGIVTAEQLPDRASGTVELFANVAPRAVIRAANPAALALAGAEDVDGFARWLPQASTPDSMRRIQNAAGQIIFSGARSVPVPVTYDCADGSHVEAITTHTRLGHDDDWRMIISVQDLTEFSRMSRELRERQELMSRVEDAAGTGSWEWNPTTDTIRGSAAFWRIIQGKGGGPTERPLKDSVNVVHAEDLPAIRELVRQALDPTSPRPASTRQELRLVRPDGSRAVASAHIFYWYGERGVVERAFGTLHDVTELRRAELEAERHREEMIRADKMISLGILVSGVAHEINNPNHSIVLNLPLLRDAWRDAAGLIDEIAANEPDLRIAGAPWKTMRDEVPDVINDIEQASERIRTIVAELKGFATDRERGDKKPTSINDVVETALRLLSNIIRKSTKHLTVELAENLSPVNISAQRIEQVIVNLVVNACQALEHDEKRVTVRTTTIDNEVCICVCDEGVGIPVDDLKKISDPFFTTKRNTGGTGLGLAVSQRIVEDHGGRLTFESEPGRGTIATLAIPIESHEVSNE